MNSALAAAVSRAATREDGIDPSKVCILSTKESPAEWCAAEELRDFLHRLTGVRPELTEGDGGGQAATFLVGRTRATGRLLESKVLVDPVTRNSEAYIVRSVGAKDGPLVVLLGGTGVATLYAVYHYLETCCGVGFFCDGDQVPRRRLVPVAGIDIAAQPRFSERMAMNLTLYWYSAPWWEWEDWRQYVDWLLKARFNLLSLWDTPGEDVAWHAAWAKLGVHVADASYSGPPYGIFAPLKYGLEPYSSAGWREWQGELTRKTIQYARARRMKAVAPAVPGIVPPEFKQVYPDARTFVLSWPEHERYLHEYLHPSDPLYFKAGRTFLEEYTARYGADHFYWLENYLECDIHGPVELQREVRREIAGANFRALDAVDSQGVGLLSTWTYTVAPAAWPRELMREHIERVPAGRVRIVDQYAETCPLFAESDYFGGRRWHLGMVYSFASDTYLHGNVRLLEHQFKRLAGDPKASHCVGFYPNEETVRHNYFYFEFMAALGWNPSTVDLRSFIQSYAAARYGAAAAPQMRAVLGDLVDTVYGARGSSKPLYWHRPGTSIDYRSARSDAAYLQRLRHALERAVAQKEALRANRLYLHDLNDIARQYLGELFNFHLVELNSAFDALDRASFEHHAAMVEWTITAIEELLSHDDYYWLTPYIRKARRLPGAPPDVDRRARDILTLWAGVIRDYACRDYYELVQGYYAPRVRMYLAELRQAMRFGQHGLLGERRRELQNKYDAHEKKWVSEGFPLLDHTPDPRKVPETVEAILRRTAST